MVYQRLFFGALLIAALLGLIYLDVRSATWPAVRNLSGLTGAVVTLILILLVSLGTLELRRLFQLAGHQPLSAWPLVVNVILVCIPFFDLNLTGEGAASTPNIAGDMSDRWTAFALVIGGLGAALGVALRRKTERAIADLGVTLLMIFYLGLLPQFIARLRMEAGPSGSWLQFYVIGVIKVCDIGAYFTGMSIGKHKLIPWLSPGKTWEGFFGGIGASVLLAVGIAVWAASARQSGAPWAMPFPGLATAAVLGVLMAVVGQAGDLLESLFKRDAHAKDSAAKIPAFGGILDIIDSPLTAMPVAWWILIQ